MSFAFGFSGEDISDTEAPTSLENPSGGVPAEQPQNHAALGPQMHRVEDLLQSLTNVRLTFDTYETPDGNVVYRRQLYDIKHQAMTEEGEDANEVHNILIGNADDEVDVRKNVYEGGFKSWECSYDLVDRLHKLSESGDIEQFRCVLELGCGTALPTCYLLMKLFGSPPQNNASTFIFSDYNYEVLRLVTLPNILIHYASTLSPEDLDSLLGTDIPLNNDELLLTPALIARFSADLSARGLSLQFVSGSWGPHFIDLVAPFSPDVVLTSETIYSPESIPVVSRILVDLFAKQNKYLGLVAAKQYYFGVGGSIKEFLDVVNSQKPASMSVESTSDDLGQLKRDILQLRPTN